MASVPLPRFIAPRYNLPEQIVTAYFKATELVGASTCIVRTDVAPPAKNTFCTDLPDACPQTLFVLHLLCYSDTLHTKFANLTNHVSLLWVKIYDHKIIFNRLDSAWKVDDAVKDKETYRDKSELSIVKFLRENLQRKFPNLTDYNTSRVNLSGARTGCALSALSAFSRLYYGYPALLDLEVQGNPTSLAEKKLIAELEAILSHISENVKWEYDCNGLPQVLSVRPHGVFNYVTAVNMAAWKESWRQTQVEEILDSHFVGKERIYLVKHLGFPNVKNCWKLEVDMFCDSLIMEYKMKNLEVKNNLTVQSMVPEEPEDPAEATVSKETGRSLRSGKVYF